MPKAPKAQRYIIEEANYQITVAPNAATGTVMLTGQHYMYWQAQNGAFRVRHSHRCAYIDQVRPTNTGEIHGHRYGTLRDSTAIR